MKKTSEKYDFIEPFNKRRIVSPENHQKHCYFCHEIRLKIVENSKNEKRNKLSST